MLGRLLGRGESRAVSYQSVWGSGGDWSTGQSWAGKHISQTQSLQISTVYACVRLYVDTISTLPIGAFRRADGVRRPTARPMWMDEPYPGVPWSTHVQQGLVSLLLNGNWYTRVYRNAIGEPVALLVLNPLLVEPQQTSDGRVVYVWNGGETVIDQNDMLHLTELLMPGEVKGVSRIDSVKQELGLAQALTEFAARFFSNGAAIGGVLETPAVMTKEQAQQAKDAFESTHRGAGKAHGVAVVGGGGRFVKTSTDPDEAQMLESRAQSIENIARVFRVPPPKIGITTPGSMSYASVEQLNMAWTIDSVRPYVEKIETAYSRLMPRGEFSKINIDALLRGDTASRYTAYSQALDAGWAATNDVRRLEDMPPVEGGDVLRVPLENIALPAANVVETEKNVAMAVQLISAGADPAQTLAAFGLPPIDFPAPPAPEPMTDAPDSPDDVNESPDGEDDDDR
jgi:HK97 family phage portal protein